MLYERNTARLHLSNIHLTNHLFSMDFLTERNDLKLEQANKGFIMIYANYSNQISCDVNTVGVDTLKAVEIKEFIFTCTGS